MGKLGKKSNRYWFIVILLTIPTFTAYSQNPIKNGLIILDTMKIDTAIIVEFHKFAVKDAFSNLVISKDVLTKLTKRKDCITYNELADNDGYYLLNLCEFSTLYMRYNSELSLMNTEIESQIHTIMLNCGEANLKILETKYQKLCKKNKYAELAVNNFILCLVKNSLLNIYLFDNELKFSPTTSYSVVLVPVR